MAQRDVDSDAYIRDLVRGGDQDRYWAALLAPEPVRSHLLALYAFNIDLARIPEQVSEPQLGEIRLQWWREALGCVLAGGEAEHPVLRALGQAASAHSLPKAALDGMIDARSIEIHHEPMPDFVALERYLTATAGAVFSLGAMILGAEAHPASHFAASAYGLTGLMRALPYHAARGQIFLPGDLLAKHGLHPNAILQGNDNADLRAALRDMALKASEGLNAFRQAAAALPRQALTAFLPLVLVEPYLKQLTSPGHRPLQDIAQLNPIRRYALIWRGFLTGRI